MSYYERINDNQLFSMLNRSISAKDRKAIKDELRSRGYFNHNRYPVGHPALIGA
jgi:hypothetical protein